MTRFPAQEASGIVISRRDDFAWKAPEPVGKPVFASPKLGRYKTGSVYPLSDFYIENRRIDA
jgi:hypothetical protein